VLRQLAEPCVFVVWQSDGQGAHASEVKHF
jgi:hypothetical protein